MAYRSVTPVGGGPAAFGTMERSGYHPPSSTTAAVSDSTTHRYYYQPQQPGAQNSTSSASSVHHQSGAISERGNGGGYYYTSSSSSKPPPPPPQQQLGGGGVQHHHVGGSPQPPPAGATPSSSSIISSTDASPPHQSEPQRYRTTTTTLTTSNGRAGGMEGTGGNGGAIRNGARSRSPYHPPPPQQHNYSPPSTMNRSGESRTSRPSHYDIDPPPTYRVEHLASFAVGRQYNLVTPTDGVRKLKQMERNSAVWAQPMLLRLLPDRVSVEEIDTGEVVEQFPMELIVDPTAHQSSDPADMYNNVLLFVVEEERKESGGGATAQSRPSLGGGAAGQGGQLPTEMHIFQCVRVSSQEVAQALHNYIKGNYHKVRGGIHEESHPPTSTYYGESSPSSQQPPPRSASAHQRQQQRDYGGGSENLEMDVNTLNRCFDDIERFVARIQSAALAQRELEMQQMRMQQRRHPSKSKAAKEAAAVAAQRGILQLRAQLPSHNEFFEVFQKFKLSFNLLAKLRNHIHEPNAPELLHFLFTPLTVILDACHWGLGRNIGEQVLSPLLSLDACDLLRNCLNSKEHDVWMALGASWRTPPEEWGTALPAPYRPVFSDGFAPYGYPPYYFEQQQQMGARQPGMGPTPPGMMHPTQTQPIYGMQQSKGMMGVGGGGRGGLPGGGLISPPGAMHRGVSAPPPSSQHLPPPSRMGMGPFGGVGPQPIYGSQALGPPPGPRGGDTYGFARSVGNLRQDLEAEKLNLEKERLDFERMKVIDREQQLFEKERRLRDEEARLEVERRILAKDAERRSLAAESDRPDFYRRDKYSLHSSSLHPSPHTERRGGGGAAVGGSVQVLPTSATMASTMNGHAGAHRRLPTPSEPISAAQKAFLDELVAKRNSAGGCKIVQVTYDRAAQNPKELSVMRGEYLEVLQDAKNWWECRNANGRLGYVPHTILLMVTHLVGGEAQPTRQGSALGSPHSGTEGLLSLSIPPPPPPHRFDDEAIRTRVAESIHHPPVSGGRGGANIRLRPQYPQHQAMEEGGFLYKPALDDAAQRLSKRVLAGQGYVPEIVESIKHRQQILRTGSGTGSAGSGRGRVAELNEASTPGQLQRWLKDKEFSDYVQGVLAECSAADAFRLSKAAILASCGEEGNRLHSLLLVQKRLSNFSHSTSMMDGSDHDAMVSHQLKALLRERREHMDRAGVDLGEEPQVNAPQRGNYSRVGRDSTTSPTPPPTPTAQGSPSLLVARAPHHNHHRKQMSEGASGLLEIGGPRPLPRKTLGSKGVGEPTVWRIITPPRLEPTTSTSVTELRSVDVCERKEDLVKAVRHYH